MYGENSIKQIIDAEGTWKIDKDDKGNVELKMSIKKYPGQDTVYLSDGTWLTAAGICFYIKGHNGFFNNRPPWYIRVIDNFNDFNSYDFDKVN